MFKFFLDIDKVDKVVAPIPRASELLFEACELTDEVRVFLYVTEHGADVNAVNDAGNTPLHVAAYNGSISIVNFLLTHGADVNAFGAAHNAALHYAVKQNHFRVVELLLKQKANPNCVNDVGYSPLHVAVCKTAGASRRREALAALLKAPQINLELADTAGNTALHLAVAASDGNDVSTLVEKGARTLARNSKNQTPLVVAESLPPGEHRTTIAKVLNEAVVAHCPWLSETTSSHSLTHIAVPESKPINRTPQPQSNVESHNLTGTATAKPETAHHHDFPLRQYVASFHAAQSSKDTDQPTAINDLGVVNSRNSSIAGPTTAEVAENEKAVGDASIAANPAAVSESTVELDTTATAPNSLSNGEENENSDNTDDVDTFLSSPNESDDEEPFSTDGGDDGIIEWACDARDAKTFPVAEDRCAVCHEKWGQYRCGRTGADVCSLECKAINLMRVQADSTAGTDESTVSLTDLHSIDYTKITQPPVCAVCGEMALYSYSLSGDFVCSQQCKSTLRETLKTTSNINQPTNQVSGPTTSVDEKDESVTGLAVETPTRSARTSIVDRLRNVSESALSGASQIVEKAKALDVAADDVWQRASAHVAAAAATARTAAATASAEAAGRTDKCRVCGQSVEFVRLKTHVMC